MTTFCRTCLYLCVVLPAALPAFAQTTGYVYLRSNTAVPWDVTSNETDMDDAFGAGNWDDLRYETVDPNALFTPTTLFILMEGGDNNANALQTFLTNNSASIAAWVNAGGRLLINAAPNQGNGMDMGFGVTLNFDPVNYTSASNNAVAVDGTGPIFNGPLTPVGTTFSGGDSFSHAYLTGGDTLQPILQDDESRTVLAQMTAGQGLVIFGGMTVDVFQSPWPNTHNLRVNLICYLAGASIATTTTTTTTSTLVNR
jgi:hypothetical protein